MTLNVATKLKKRASEQSQGPVLQLHIPIPQVSSSKAILVAKKKKKKKKNEDESNGLIIEFAYQNQLVTAKCLAHEDDEKLIHVKGLLHELFPQDTGDSLVIGTGNDRTVSKQTGKGKPYHWCNYIAGLQPISTTTLSAPSYATMFLSTQTVMQALLARIRSNATVSQLVHGFKTHQTVGIHPTLSNKNGLLSTDDCSCKLIEWTSLPDEDGNTPPHVRTYLASLQESNSEIPKQQRSIHVSVRVDLAQYPRKPPVWNLTTAATTAQSDSSPSLDSGTNQLFDNALGQIQERLHVHLDQLIDPDNEETCDWILSHQLQYLMNLWSDRELSSSSDAGKRGNLKR